MEARKVLARAHMLYRLVYVRPLLVRRTKSSPHPSWRYDAVVILLCVLLAVINLF